MICGFPKFPKICSKFARIRPEKLRIWTLSTQCDFYIIIWCGSIRMKTLIFTIPLISTLRFMFHLTLKLKLLEKWKCKSTAFCNLYLINSGLFSSLIYLDDILVRKNQEWAGGKFSGESDFRLLTACRASTLDSDSQNVPINFTHAN